MMHNFVSLHWQMKQKMTARIDAVKLANPGHELTASEIASIGGAALQEMEAAVKQQFEQLSTDFHVFEDASDDLEAVVLKVAEAERLGHEDEVRQVQIGNEWKKNSGKQSK